ncbi:Hypothetical predicted protein, partial [Paramuricea clavata]
FGLYFDGEGVMRSRGRVNASSLPPNSKNPIFLPSKHQFVELLTRRTHNQIMHSGVRDTLTTLRERFWILRGRETIKKIIRHCVVCRKCEGGHFKSQPTPDLPAIRVSDDPPFTHVGLDFAGPLFIRSKPNESPTIQNDIGLSTLNLLEELACKHFYLRLDGFLVDEDCQPQLHPTTLKLSSRPVRTLGK